MLNANAIYTAPGAGPPSVLAPELATYANTIVNSYFQFRGNDFDDGTHTHLHEILHLTDQLTTVIRINMLYGLILAMTGVADPIREEAVDTKQRLIYELQQRLDATPWQRDTMAARIAQLLFDPNVGAIASGWITGGPASDVDVAQVVIHAILKR